MKTKIIKILKDTKCILPKDVIIPKYEVVTIIDEKDTLLVKNVIDEYMLIPCDTLYKIVKTKEIKKPDIKAIYKSLKTSILSNIEINADNEGYDPFGPQPFAEYGIKIKRRPKEKVKTPPIMLRVLQKAQIICSNAMTTDNILESNKLILAAIYANMAGIQNLQTNQINRLLMMCNKLLGNSNNTGES